MAEGEHEEDNDEWAEEDGRAEPAYVAATLPDPSNFDTLPMDPLEELLVPVALFADPGDAVEEPPAGERSAERGAARLDPTAAADRLQFLKWLGKEFARSALPCVH